MIKLTMAVKSEITKDWAACFPSFGIYKPLWIMRRIGPLLEGICLNRDSSNERYQPIFHVHNLAITHPSISLTLAEYLRTTRNNSPEKIKAAFHKDHLIDATERMNAQALLPMEGNWTLEGVITAYRIYMQRPLAKYSIQLFEDVITTLLWCGRNDEAKEELAKWTEEMKKWPQSVASIQRVGGVEQWNHSCSEWIQSPAIVRDTVDDQIVMHGVGNLPSAELLP